MKQLFISHIFAVCFVCATVLLGCQDDVQLPEQPLDDYEQVYMPQAVNGPVEKTLIISENPQEIVYGVDFGGQDYPKEDIQVTFSISQSKVDAFNQANNTTYELLLSAAYTLSATTAIIPKGELATNPLTLSILTSGEKGIPPFKSYLLPISIEESSFKVNEELRTVYFIIHAEPNLADYPDFNRDDWKMVDFSSEEANGEGPNNGRAIFVLDKDINTFWHSQWQGANPGPPHYLTVDLGKVETLHGISATARQVDGGGKPNEVQIETSMDNVHWKVSGKFNLAFTKDPQKKFLAEFVEARYFKFVVLSSYSSTNVHLAELGAF